MKRRTRPPLPAGFTIVETLIVLAIAGLILLIVLIALPALGRAGRNNQRRQDVTTILQAVSHYELSNSGGMPASLGALTIPNNGLSYYSPPSIKVVAQQNIDSSNPNFAVNHAAINSLDQVYIYNYERCYLTTTGAATIQGAGFNDVVALFAIETSSGSVPQCQQL